MWRHVHWFPLRLRGVEDVHVLSSSLLAIAVYETERGTEFVGVGIWDAKGAEQGFITHRVRKAWDMVEIPVAGGASVCGCAYREWEAVQRRKGFSIVFACQHDDYQYFP